MDVIILFFVFWLLSQSKKNILPVTMAAAMAVAGILTLAILDVIMLIDGYAAGCMKD
jgi:hypothetical protein